MARISALTIGIRHALNAHPDGPTFRSLFIAPDSWLCAATLLAEIGDCRDRYPTYRTLAADAGQCPVAVESGKAKRAQFRWACDHRLRAAIDSLADASRHHNPWAADIYDRATARGASHPHAVRILGRAWCQVIWRLWQDHHTGGHQRVAALPCGRRLQSRLPSVTTRAVVIIGAPGAGKSSVAEKLATLLEIAGVEFGALESEQLGWGSPWLAHEHVVRQLRAVAGLQRQAGRTTFLVVATPETAEQLADVIDAIGADQIATVLLTAPPELVAERIAAREPDSWPGKRRLIAHAQHLASTMSHLSSVDVRVGTQDRDADQVAAEVLSALKALGVLA